MENRPSEDEDASINTGLTIATVILCTVGPFWFVGKLVKRVSGKIILDSNHDAQRTRKLAQEQE